MNGRHLRWIAVGFLILAALRFAHSMHWIGPTTQWRQAVAEADQQDLADAMTDEASRAW